MQLIEVRKELHFNSELVVLIETLKNIAGAQYQLMDREKKKRFERFMLAFADFFKVAHLAEVDDPLVRSASPVLGLIVVTSDAGFMGGLNGAVIDAAIAESSRPGAEETHLIVIGDKGANVFRDAGRPFRFFQGIPGQDRYERAVEVRDYVVRQVLERRIGRVAVVYPRPLSFTRQVVEVANLLPCATLFEHSGELEAGLLGSPWLRRQAVVESPLSEMAAYLAGVWVTSKLLEIFDDSKLSEFAARAMHLEGSVQKLQQENKKLKYRFFRAAHEHVDKGMRESFTSKKLRDTQKAEKLASADRRARAT